MTRLAATAGPGRQAGEGRATSGDDAVAAQAEDFYRLLDIPYSATAAEIDRAYRTAMRRVHPDRQRPEHRTAAEEQAKRLNLAYATLAKPERRLAYDRTIKTRAMQDEIMSRYVGGFVPPPADGAEPSADGLRRPLTAAERRERTRADRTALASLLVVFGAIALVVIGALVVWALAEALAGALF